jgi:hypothetical protein
MLLLLKRSAASRLVLLLSLKGERTLSRKSYHKIPLMRRGY